MLEIYKPVSNKDSIYFDEPVGSLKDLFQDIVATMNTNSIHNDIINCACGVIPAPHQVRDKLQRESRNSKTEIQRLDSGSSPE